MTDPTAVMDVVIVDDEPAARRTLREFCEKEADLRVIAEYGDGRAALDAIRERPPQLLFLHIQMPFLNGLAMARALDPQTLPLIVFVTAYDQYAVQAFEHGALDYLVKPLEAARLADTVARLKERLRAAQPALASEALLEQLAAQLRKDAAPNALRWLRVSVGQTLRMVAIDEIDFLRSDEKYTLVAWRGEDGKASEGLIRTPLKDLLPQLDAAHFAQVHRSVVVNLRAISHVMRGDNETADIHLKGRGEVLPVSRTYLHLFRQM